MRHILKLGLRAKIGVGFLASAAVGFGLGARFPAADEPYDWIVALLLLAIAALAGILVGRAISRRLRALADAAGIWGRGDLSHRAPLVSGDEAGELAGALNRMAGSLQHRDETTRRHAEEQMIQAEKLATIGRLAAGVAHELNNPLGGVLLYSNLIIESTPEDDPRRENMRKIVIQATRAREIVRGLLTFARKERPRIERVDLNTVVLEAISLLERQPQFQNVQIRTELSPLPLWVWVDVPKVQQVFVNIILNGAESMRRGGVLTVRSGFSGRDGFCRVAITDTGSGISEENLGRIFEPFFTTKEVGQGIGLGLAISYGIVQQHGGEIEVQSAVGAGTTFRVLLPVEREE